MGKSIAAMAQYSEGRVVHNVNFKLSLQFHASECEAHELRIAFSSTALVNPSTS